MPFVRVYLKNGVTPEALEATNFYRALRKSVTTALYCEDDGGTLEPDDVDVHFVQRPPADQTKWDVTVIVDAKRTPTRTAELEYRTGLLSGDLEDFVPAGLKISAAINPVDWEWAVGEGKAV